VQRRYAPAAIAAWTIPGEEPMIQSRVVKAAFSVVLLSLLMLLAACEQKSINQILADPGRYSKTEVAIVGRVVNSFSVLGRGVYQVDDGTGKLWVISDKGVPHEGAQVVARGKIKEGFNLGSLVKLPDVVGSGLVMIESSHQAQM
jgi:hypothetical protein